MEISNRTVHGVSLISWVPYGVGGYRGQWAVLVKPNGLLGTFYMAAIRPFRHLIVYPALMREIEREWRARGRRSNGGAAPQGKSSHRGVASIKTSTGSDNPGPGAAKPRALGT